MKIAFRALGRILPDNSMSGHPKGSKIWILETAIAYIGELTIQANRLNPEACRHLHENFQIVLRDRWYNKDADLASVSVDLQDTKDLPVLTASSAPPMNPMPVPPMNPMPAPPMNPMPAPPLNLMPDIPAVSQPLTTVQNGQVPYQPQICQAQNDPFFGQQRLISDQATHQQPTIAPKPDHVIPGSSNPSCLWGGLNPSHQTTMLQGHATGPHSSYPMNVPYLGNSHPGESHMGTRHPNQGPPLMQSGISASNFPPQSYLPALASSIDCPPMFPTPNEHFFHSAPNTHLPSPAYPTPIGNKINMSSNDSGYSGMASSITLDSSTNSNTSNNSKSRRRKTSSTFSPYPRNMRLDEIISFTNQPF